jgi:ParB family transcriptional regulator, chromosome partitioning protein
MGKHALDAQRFDAFFLPPEQIKLITDTKHPLYDPAVELPVNEGLVLSMMSTGFHGSILVWKDGEQVVILDGRQRTKAALEANRRLKAAGREPILVRAMIERGDEATLFGVQALANEGRRTVSDLERSRILQRLVAFGRTEEHAGAILGLDKAQTRRVAALLDCAAPVIKAIEDGKIASTAAAKLSKLPREEQGKALDTLLAAGPTERSSRATVANVNKAVKAAQGDTGPEAPPRRLVKRVAELARDEKADDAECKTIAQVLDWVLAGKEPPKNASLYALIHAEPDDGKLPSATMPGDGRQRAKQQTLKAVK